MADEILRTALAEEARLKAELEKLPLFQKLTTVQRLIALYQNGPTSVAVPGFTQQRLAAAHAFGAGVVQTASADAIRTAAAEYLRGKGSRAQTPEIVEALETRGVIVNSHRKVPTVSSYLSSSDLFDNTRGAGYGLAEWTKKPEPNMASTGGENTAEAPRDTAQTETADPMQEPAVQ